MKEKRWNTKSAEETIECGRVIGRALKPGSIVALIGDLGSGKTTLVKGIAAGLRVRNPKAVKSPTFVIQHIYEGPVALYHFDLYRLEGDSDAEAVGMDDFLGDSDGVSVIEWADRIPSVLKHSDLEVKLEHAGDTKRQICVTYHGH